MTLLDSVMVIIADQGKLGQCELHEHKFDLNMPYLLKLSTKMLHLWV